MGDGAAAMANVNAKLDWAVSRHDEMVRIFEEHEKPGGGDERPNGITFDWEWVGNQDVCDVVASFISEVETPIEVGMLAADLIHNARTALDYVLAQLKTHFGGNPGQGGFPVCRNREVWERTRTLRGLAQPAKELIERHQPFHRSLPATDPLAELVRINNIDKHRLFNAAYIDSIASNGLDLVEVLDEERVTHRQSLWFRGERLLDGTKLATFRVTGDPQTAVRASGRPLLMYAVAGKQMTLIAMIERVRSIASEAEALIDRGMLVEV